MFEKPKSSPAREDLTRRDLTRKGVKAAYVAPAILAVVGASERPAYGQASADKIKEKNDKDKVKINAKNDEKKVKIELPK